jgi:hypothetical protein
LEAVAGVLQMDFRPGGMHGFVLARDVRVHDLRSGESVRLCKDDRLEPRGDVRDVHEFQPATMPDPASLFFFRRKASVFLNFIPLLFSAPFFRFEYIAHDVLHTLDLGVAARLVGATLQGLLRHGAFGNRSSKAGFLAGLRVLNRSLHDYILEQGRVYRARLKGAFSCCRRLTLGMLGLSKTLNAKATLKAKGIEVRHMVGFCILQLRPHTQRIPHGRTHLLALTHLRQAYALMEEHDVNWPAEAASDFDYHLKRCGIYARDSEIGLLPKFHLLPHLGAQGIANGNARFSSTLEDESYNSDNVRIAATSRLKDFAARLLAKQAVLARCEVEEMQFLRSA